MSHLAGMCVSPSSPLSTTSLTLLNNSWSAGSLNDATGVADSVELAFVSVLL